MIDVARELKKRNAGRIFICATFGLFTSGFEKFDRAYEDGLFHAMLTTNLVYQAPGASGEAVLHRMRHEQIHRTSDRYLKSRWLDQ